MSDILKDTPAYRWMTEDAREEGLQEGIKQGRELARQAAQKEIIEQLRGKIVGLVATRFPKLARFTRKQISDIEGTEQLLDLLINIKIDGNAKDVIDYLIALDEEELATL